MSVSKSSCHGLKYVSGNVRVVDFGTNQEKTEGRGSESYYSLMRTKMRNHDMFCPKCFARWIECVDINYLIRTTCNRCGAKIELSVSYC